MSSNRGIETGAVHIGTSGWHYGHWVGSFYPEGLKAEDYLSYYAERFRTVEINNSFYRLPQDQTLKKWRNTVPGNFVFAVKGSRFITHNKKLKDPGRSLPALMQKLELLRGKLGPILFQLPPRWHFDSARLAAFLEALPQKHRYAMEMRDRTWMNSQALEILARFNVAFCIYDLQGYLTPREVTADHVYIRLHGPWKSYQGKYSTQALAGWAGAISTWSRQGKEVFCYFDNDEAGYAAQDAARLQQMLVKG